MVSVIISWEEVLVLTIGTNEV